MSINAISCRSTLRSVAATLALIVLAAPAFAEARCEPIAAAKVEGMWAAYASGDVQPSPTDGPYECIASKKIPQVTCRTIASNPAHPSIVVRTIIQHNKGLAIQTEASTAAECDDFLAMMKMWDALNAEMMKELSKPQ